MTENLELKQQFIALRAKGYSLEKISKQIGKCRQTLANWNSDLQEEIANAKSIELEALFEECLLSKQHRIRELHRLLSKIKEELPGNEDINCIIQFLQQSSRGIYR